MRGSRGLMSGVGGRLRDGMFRVWSVDLDASVGVVAGLGRLALACHSDIWLRVLDHATQSLHWLVASFIVPIVHINPFRSMNRSYAKSDLLKGKTTS